MQIQPRQRKLWPESASPHFHTHNHHRLTTGRGILLVLLLAPRCDCSFNVGIVPVPRAIPAADCRLYLLLSLDAAGPQCNLVRIFTTCWLSSSPLRLAMGPGLCYFGWPIYLFFFLCCCHIAIFKFIRNVWGFLFVLFF